MSRIIEKPENNETTPESTIPTVPEQIPEQPSSQTGSQQSEAKRFDSAINIPTSSSTLPAAHSIQIPPAIYNNNGNRSLNSNYAKYATEHDQATAEAPPPYSSVVPVRTSTSSRPHIVNIVENERHREGFRERIRRRRSPIPRWVIVLILIILIPLVISITSVRVSGKDPFDGTTNNPNEEATL
jgi:hypothetical protein